MVATALDALVDRVEVMLKDGSNVIYSATELTEAIRSAIAELAVGLPAHSVTEIAAVADTWEYSLTALTGLLGVVEVWYPYLSTSVTYRKAHPVRWRMVDDATLLLDERVRPDAAYKLRVFWDKGQTLEGLDAATATTLTGPELGAIVVGAAGLAVAAYAAQMANAVGVAEEPAKVLREWARLRLEDFQKRLVRLGAVESASEDARVGWWSADKWDRAGSHLDD